MSFETEFSIYIDLKKEGLGPWEINLPYEYDDGSWGTYLAHANLNFNYTSTNIVGGQAWYLTYNRFAGTEFFDNVVPYTYIMLNTSLPSETYDISGNSTNIFGKVFPYVKDQGDKYSTHVSYEFSEESNPEILILENDNKFVLKMGSGLSATPILLQTPGNYKYWLGDNNNNIWNFISGALTLNFFRMK